MIDNYHNAKRFRNVEAKAPPPAAFGRFNHHYFAEPEEKAPDRIGSAGKLRSMQRTELSLDQNRLSRRKFKSSSNLQKITSTESSPEWQKLSRPTTSGKLLTVDMKRGRLRALDRLNTERQPPSSRAARRPQLRLPQRHLRTEMVNIYSPQQQYVKKQCIKFEPTCRGRLDKRMLELAKIKSQEKIEQKPAKPRHYERMRQQKLKRQFEELCRSPVKSPEKRPTRYQSPKQKRHENEASFEKKQRIIQKIPSSSSVAAECIKQAAVSVSTDIQQNIRGPTVQSPHKQMLEQPKLVKMPTFSELPSKVNDLLPALPIIVQPKQQYTPLFQTDSKATASFGQPQSLRVEEFHTHSPYLEQSSGSGSSNSLKLESHIKGGRNSSINQSRLFSKLHTIRKSRLSGGTQIQAILQKVDLHLEIINRMAQYVQDSENLYEGNIWRNEKFLMYKRYYVERVRVVESLNGGRNCFILSQIQITKEQLTKNYPKTRQLSSGIQKQNHEIRKCLQSLYNALRLKNTEHPTLNLHFETACMNRLNDELIQSLSKQYNILKKLRLSEQQEDRRIAISQRLVEVIQVTFLMEELSDRFVKGFIECQEVDNLDVFLHENQGLFESIKKKYGKRHHG